MSIFSKVDFCMPIFLQYLLISWFWLLLSNSFNILRLLTKCHLLKSTFKNFTGLSILQIHKNGTVLNVNIFEKPQQINRNTQQFRVDRPLTCARHRLRPVDNKGIDVVQLQILQRGFQVGLHMLGPVIGVPQLGLDEEILALDHALGKQLLQGLADLQPS